MIIPFDVMETHTQVGVPRTSYSHRKRRVEDVVGTSREVGVNLKQGYNGDLTSREAGSVGGQMVKKMNTVRTTKYTRADRTAIGHEIEVRYIATITI